MHNLSPIDENNDVPTKKFVEDADALKVSKSGDTMTGSLTAPFLASTGGVQVTRPAGNAGNLEFATVSLLRWTMGKGPGAETGANAGSDFNLASWDDAGNWLANPMRIIRRTSEVHFPGSVIVDGTIQASWIDVLSGAWFGGQIIQSLAPTAVDHLANKAYVDGRVNKAGDVMSGLLTLRDVVASAEPVGAASLIIDRDTYPLIQLNKRSSTLLGRWNIYISGDAGDANPSLTFSRVNAQGVAQTYVRIYPDGHVLLGADPVGSLDAVTKQYADTKVASSGDTMTAALKFGSSVAASLTSVARHIDLYGGTFGFNVTNNRLGIVSGANIGLSAAGADRVTIDSGGLAMASGMTIDTASGNVQGLNVNCYGIGYPGFTYQSGGNRIGMKWASNNIYGGVDNVNSMVLGTVSTRKSKAAIIDLKGALAKLRRLRPVEFSPVDIPNDSVVEKHERRLGLIADEVDTVLPGLVNKDPEGQAAGVNYLLLVPLLIGAVKELTDRVEALEARLV